MDIKFFRSDAQEDVFDISIDRNGQWFHQGKPISRQALVKLFSTVLYYNTENNEYWLVTPHEQGRVDVADVPYVIIKHIIRDIGTDHQVISLETNLEDEVDVGPDHPIIYNEDNGMTYVIVKNNAMARLNRVVREALIQIALDQDGYDAETGYLYIHSNNERFIVAGINEGKNNI